MATASVQLRNDGASRTGPPGRFSACSAALRRSRQDLICTIYAHFSAAANTGLVLAATVGLTFSVQARFASSLVVDLAARVVLAGFALIALAHPDPWVAAGACVPVALFAGFWLLRRRGDG